MAVLNKFDNRESWLKWAIEFMRRGLWLVDEVEVHGPHGVDSDYMWGKGTVIEDGGNKFPFQVSFSTARKIRGIHDVRGVRLICTDTSETFSLRPEAKLSRNARRWLTVAKRVHARLRHEAIGGRKTASIFHRYDIVDENDLQNVAELFNKKAAA